MLKLEVKLHNFRRELELAWVWRCNGSSHSSHRPKGYMTYNIWALTLR